MRGERIQIALKAGHHLRDSETTFKWLLACGLMIAIHWMLTWHLWIRACWCWSIHSTLKLGTNARKPVFWVSDQVRFNLVCTATNRGGGGGGGQGVWSTRKITTKIWFLSNTVLDPLENYKATKPAFNVGHHRHASETPFKWRFAGGPVMVCF